MNKFEKTLCYDDVLLVPQASHILPRDVDLSSRITNNIKIKNIGNTMIK